MMLVDTHTHPYLPEFDHPQQTVSNALNEGVEHMILPAVDLSSIEPMLSLQDTFPSEISLAFGLHPTEVRYDYMEVIDRMKDVARKNRHVAIGEIGIDLYWDKTFHSAQCRAFSVQVEWAIEENLPVIIHCREGLDDTLNVLANASAVPRGVMHSFGGTADDVERIRKIGDFYFGINGIVTFKNSKLRDLLQIIGLDRILLETDAPYLAPVPMRGKRNEPAYLVHTANHIAQYMGISSNELAEITTQNARNLFNF
ncbi:MAG: TatD family hydrolase [Muribaculum sp.]|nr:TatD family hydrolase [Muribaculum sp.]